MFSLNKEQVRYFRDHLQIEFEEVFKDDQVDLAVESLNQIKKKLASLDLENPGKSRIELKKMLRNLNRGKVFYVRTGLAVRHSAGPASRGLTRS